MLGRKPSFHRRRAKRIGTDQVSGVPRPLLPHLKSCLACGERLVTLGLKTSAAHFDVTVYDLLDRYNELVLADSIEVSIQCFSREILSKGYTGALILSNMSVALAADIGQACRANGLVCVGLMSRNPDDLERCLSELDLVLEGTSMVSV